MSKKNSSKARVKDLNSLLTRSGSSFHLNSKNYDTLKHSKKENKMIGIANFMAVPYQCILVNGTPVIPVVIISKGKAAIDIEKNKLLFKYRPYLIDESDHCFSFWIDIPEQVFHSVDWVLEMLPILKDFELDREEFQKYLKEIAPFLSIPYREYIGKEFYAEVDGNTRNIFIEGRENRIAITQYEKLRQVHKNLPFLVSYYYISKFTDLLNYIGEDAPLALNIVTNEDSFPDVLRLLGEIENIIFPPQWYPPLIVEMQDLSMRKNAIRQVAQHKPMIFNGFRNGVTCITARTEFQRAVKRGKDAIYISAEKTESRTFINLDFSDYRINPSDEYGIECYLGDAYIEMNILTDFINNAESGYLDFYQVEVDWVYRLLDLIRRPQMSCAEIYMRLRRDFFYTLTLSTMVGRESIDFFLSDSMKEHNKHLLNFPSDTRPIRLAENDEIEIMFKNIWNLYNGDEGAEHFPTPSGPTDRPTASLGFRQKADEGTVIFLNPTYFEKYPAHEKLVKQAAKSEKYKYIFAENHGAGKRKLTGNTSLYALWERKLIGYNSP